MAHYKGGSSDARVRQLKREREQMLLDAEHKKLKILEEKNVEIVDKFTSNVDTMEQAISSSTVGLLTLEQMREKQQNALEERQRQIAKSAEHEMKVKTELQEKKLLEKEKQSKQIKALSFAFDNDDEDDEDEDDSGDAKEKEVEKSPKEDADVESEPEFKKKPMKNPLVDTSYLPDRARDAEERKLREKLRQDWVEKQEITKNEEIEITYSYWDGAGHRKSLVMKKGNTIYQFLQKCLETCRNDFMELRTATTDQLMYIKEDVILPHDSTFYDFIITKARGKSGPLFNFDVHDDVRMLADATVERDESHAGKVLLRSWYKNHKHIFPCNRWEPYDPHKKYEKYTISDKTV